MIREKFFLGHFCYFFPSAYTSLIKLLKTPELSLRMASCHSAKVKKPVFYSPLHTLFEVV